jgi:hypothetical protein
MRDHSSISVLPDDAAFRYADGVLDIVGTGEQMRLKLGATNITLKVRGSAPGRSRKMPGKRASDGVVHDVPTDLKETLVSDNEALAIWEDSTPLARNEWICWVENAKREKRRLHRIESISTDLKKGKRRPCCWPGCPHRK